MWRYELDPKPVLSQLEKKREISSESNPTVYGNIQHMIEDVKAGVTHKNGNF